MAKRHQYIAIAYIKYDPATKNGYALRFWRTTESAEKCVPVPLEVHPRNHHWRQA